MYFGLKPNHIKSSLIYSNEDLMEEDEINFMKNDFDLIYDDYMWNHSNEWPRCDNMDKKTHALIRQFVFVYKMVEDDKYWHKSFVDTIIDGWKYATPIQYGSSKSEKCSIHIQRVIEKYSSPFYTQWIHQWGYHSKEIPFQKTAACMHLHLSHLYKAIGYEEIREKSMKIIMDEWHCRFIQPDIPKDRWMAKMSEGKGFERRLSQRDVWNAFNDYANIGNYAASCSK